MSLAVVSESQVIEQISRFFFLLDYAVRMCVCVLVCGGQRLISSVILVLTQLY